MMASMRGLLGSTDSQLSFGVLVLRLGIGATFIAHGVPKLRMGPEGWTQLGQAVSQLGIHSGHQIFGLLAGLSETVGGLFLALGFLTRLVTIPMLFTMGVAAASHYARGEGFRGAAHAIELGIVLLALLIAGAGRYSVDARLAGPPRWS
jgi:putative oxidoreductase